MSKLTTIIAGKRAAIAALPIILASCGGLPQIGNSDKGITAPALEVLALDFERTNFNSRSRVSGRLAQQQRDLLVSTPTSGRLRNEAHGPIPTEVRVDVTELVTSGNRVTMKGSLGLRDLGLGRIMATKEDFVASGPMPIAMQGAGAKGLIFRGVEAEILAWLETLECDTAIRKCAKPAPKPVVVEPEEEPVDGLSEGADLELAEMVGARPRGLRGLNSGGIQADKVIAAAAPVEVEETPVETAQPKLLGTTVAALGLLDRSGFWLQTPLVREETTGIVVNPATGKRLNVVLVPKSGPQGGGSQISLAALNQLGAQITDLVTLEVYR